MCQNRGAAREDGPETHSMPFHEDRSRNDTSGSKAKTINHPMPKERKRERETERERKKVRSTPISFNTHEAYKLQMFQ